jgi:serine/threonine-protein kinase SRPK3
LTGDYLFDPQSGSKYSRDDDHIAQIIELLGPLPTQLINTGRWSSEFFNRKGELRAIQKLKPWALRDVLVDKYHYDEEEAVVIASFLLPMLELTPRKRADAGGMSNHLWINNVPRLEHLHVDRPINSRGTDIEGWANEVRTKK